MADRILRFGVIGLSRGFVLSRPMFLKDPRVRLVAAADPRTEARAAFEAEFGGRAYPDAEALCADPEVEVVYIASPHELHAAQAEAAARAGKHLLVEKPMALTLEACRAMRTAAEAAGVALLAGPSHGYDAPVVRAAALIGSGRYGRLRMISMITYTDFLYRPRRPEELETAKGGSVVFSQAAHQVDVVRRLASAPVTSVRAQAGAWDPRRPSEGAYQAFLTFANGATASLTYSGYGRYDTDALMGWTGELGQARDPADYAGARRRLEGADEAELKRLRAYGSGPLPEPATPAGHEHFGFVLASCERADLRLTPSAIEVYGETRETVELPPPAVPRQGVVDEVWGAVVEGRPPVHDGAWGGANLAVCLALLRSSQEGREVPVTEETP
ncbi:Gfo/Idh/MocA family oxidoreductase [Phenylobacterium sp.]|uniref:Gfo/Idh/MocA family protein n=1 Tax=Phenylobacterium sp. TaxID=1871053 RepID=UPI002BE99023|nr:Gfo/Idh/MocA family oxidoreductase [Phenylobacterium sp.]HVI33873.1 Gfo/Idh/MocA family oxidoreductase [Phenylobacterium sp.]